MDKIKKIIALFFIGIYVSFYVNTTLFSHLHTISGKTITHSHMHTDSHHDSKSGGHTAQNVIFIAQLSHLELINCSNCDLPSLPEFTLHDEKVIKSPHWATAIHLQNLSLRAPPVLS